MALRYDWLYLAENLSGRAKNGAFSRAKNSTLGYFCLVQAEEGRCDYDSESRNWQHLPLLLGATAMAISGVSVFFTRSPAVMKDAIEC